MRRRIKVDDPQNYVLRLVPTKALKPSQTGEDYTNDSSRETARWIREAGPESDIEDNRWQDLLPVLADAEGKIRDGNHRHSAAVENKDPIMLAMVPKSSRFAKLPPYRLSTQGQQPTPHCVEDL